MPAILVRNLSPETLAGLKARAKRNNRSTQAEVAEILEREARTEFRGNAFWAAAEKARHESAGKWFGDSADLIREDRDSR